MALLFKDSWGFLTVQYKHSTAWCRNWTLGRTGGGRGLKLAQTEREIERRAMKQGLVSALAKERQQQGCGR